MADEPAEKKPRRAPRKAAAPKAAQTPPESVGEITAEAAPPKQRAPRKAAPKRATASDESAPVPVASTNAPVDEPAQEPTEAPAPIAKTASRARGRREPAAPVAIITGATQGIGLATLEELLELGMRVVGVGRTAVDRLPELPGVVAIEADLTDPEVYEEIVEATIEEFGQIDVLVNNVGGGDIHVGGWSSISDASWHAAWELNFMSAVRATRAAMPHLIARHGAIVNVSCVNAIQPESTTLNVSVAKAALLAFSKAVALEVARDGVTVNCVSPGAVLTPMWTDRNGIADLLADATGQDRESVLAATAAEIPIGRFTQPEEVARLIAYLTSGDAKAITGADFSIDGGVVNTIR